MMRWLACSWLFGACVHSQSPADEPPATGEPPARGVVDGQAFVARTALMLMKNVPGRNCAWPGFVSGCSDPTGASSFIRIYDRQVTCAETRITDTGIREAAIGREEHTLFVQIEGSWPLAAGTRTVGPADSGDHVYVHYDEGGDGIGRLDGTMQVIAASSTGGILRFDVVRNNLGTANTFAGTIGFTVCR